MGIEISELEVQLLSKYLLSTCGIVVPWKKRYLFETRLKTLLEELGYRNFAQLYRSLSHTGDGRIHGQLVEAMTTNETGFFRDGHPFEALRRELLPQLAERKMSSKLSLSKRIRIASVGCSTGEEPYSIAMTLREWMKSADSQAPEEISILAVDISKAVLDHARRGTYSHDQINDSIPWKSLEFFEQTDSGYRVGDALRGLVSFSQINLNEQLEQLGYFDIIFCRNVMIYISPELKQSVLETFYKMINPEGFLLLGASEALFQMGDKFKTVHFGPTTYYKRK